MQDGNCRYRYRITLDRNALVIDRVCDSQGEALWDESDAVIEELEGEQGLLHAIVQWLQPRRVYTDNGGTETVRLVRACERLGIAVVRPWAGLPQAKGRVERLRGMRTWGKR